MGCQMPFENGEPYAKVFRRWAKLSFKLGILFLALLAIVAFLTHLDSHP
jgi:hypothetical protein